MVQLHVSCLCFRCPVYKSLPPGCTMKPDPRNKCCHVPDCHYGSVIPLNKPFYEIGLTMSRLEPPTRRLSSVKKGIDTRVIPAKLSNTQPATAALKNSSSPSIKSTGGINGISNYKTSPAKYTTRFTQLDLMNNAPGEKVLKESFNERVRKRFSTGTTQAAQSSIHNTTTTPRPPPDAFNGGVSSGRCRFEITRCTIKKTTIRDIQ